MKKTKIELTNIVKNHPTVLLLQGVISGTNCHNLELVGGAVVDIMDGMHPKDYDMLGWNSDSITAFKNAGFRFVSETKTAITYQKDGVVVQFLQTFSNNFDFKISQSSFKLKSGVLTFDEDSFYDKLLIPTQFYDGRFILNSLMRIPHWQSKGYNVPLPTYMSMVRAIGKVLSPRQSYEMHS